VDKVLDKVNDELVCAKTEIGRHPNDDVNWPSLGCTYSSQTVVDQAQVREIIVKAVTLQQDEDKEIEVRKIIWSFIISQRTNPRKMM